MEKLTHWERRLKKSGYAIIDFTHEEIVDHLLDIFKRDREHLLTKAAADDTKRHKLVFILDYDNLGDQSTYFGGTVTYDKRKRRFTYITYSDRRNWGVRFSIESKVAFFAYEFYKSIKHIFPFGYSANKFREWVKNN
jgi:hypothetical protein